MIKLLYLLIFTLLSLAASFLKPGLVVDLSRNTTTWYEDYNFGGLFGFLDYRKHPHLLQVSISEYSDNTLFVLNSDKDVKTNSNLLVNKNNVLFFRDSKSSVYYSKKVKSWVKLAMKRKGNSRPQPQAYGELIPVTMCVDNRFGSGGTVSISYNYKIGHTDNLLVLGTLTAPFLAVSALVGMSVVSSFSYTGTYSCNIGAGQYGQLYTEPFYVEVPETTVQLVVYDAVAGIFEKRGQYEDNERFRILTRDTPNHVCISAESSSRLMCAKVTQDIYLDLY